MFKSFVVAGCLAIGLPGVADCQKHFDHSIVEKIRNEGLNNSRIMDIAFHLTDVNGPRLTNSPGYNRAAEYARKTLTEWKLVNATTEPFGEFGKGWELERSYLAMTAPYYKPIIGLPKAWTSGTNGLQQAEVKLVSAKDSIEIEKYRGTLAGKILVFDRTDEYKPSFAPDAKRVTEDELKKLAEATGVRQVDSAGSARRREQMAAYRANAALVGRLQKMAREEGALAILSMNPKNHDGTVFVQGGGGYKITDPENLLDCSIALEDYMPVVRLLKAGIPVKVEMDVRTKFYNNDSKGYNVIAEIKGTDKRLKDEVVMLGGHLDSWHGSTGATDNAAGCAIMMEAVRILQTLGVKPRRTIRIALWGAEEQGLFGSKGYVRQHFGDPATMQLLPEHEKLSVYFNLDNGTGKVRGIYLQGNEAAKPIFTEWLEPFKDLGASTVTLSSTGSTDHVSFDAVGLPGFQVFPG